MLEETHGIVLCVSQRGQVVSVHLKGSKEEWVAGGSFSVWFTQLEDQETQTESPTIPYSPNSLTSCCCWNDVTGQLGMSRPHPHPLCLSPLSTWLQSLVSHCDLGLPMQHLSNTDKKATTKSVKHESLTIMLYRQRK